MYRINLILKERKERINLNRLIGTVFFILVLAAVVFTFFNDRMRINNLENEIAAIERERRSLAPLLMEAQRVEEEIEGLKEKDFFDEIFYPRTSQVEVIKEFSSLITAEMDIRRFNLNKEGSLSISGQTRDHEKVSLYMDRLDDSRFFYSINLIESASSWTDDGFRRTVFSLNIGFEESGVGEN